MQITSLLSHRNTSVLQVNRVEKPRDHNVKPHTALRCSSAGTLKSRSASVTAVTASPTRVLLTFHSSSNAANRAERDEQSPEGHSCPGSEGWNKATASRCSQAALGSLGSSRVFTRRQPGSHRRSSALPHMPVTCSFPG